MGQTEGVVRQQKVHRGACPHLLRSNQIPLYLYREQCLAAS